MKDKLMSRRRFIKYGAMGIAATAFASSFPVPRASASQAVTFQLVVRDALVEMVDTTPVYMWLFSDAVTGPGFPGPVIGGAPNYLYTGDQVTVEVFNMLDEPHAFEVVGVPGSGTGPILPGNSASVTFTAPAAGTYLYVDPLNAPVNRVLGLHGGMVVRPALGLGVNTPYTSPTANVQALFDALGNPGFPGNPFPGDPWSPDPLSAYNREKLWVLTQVCARFNTLAQNGGSVENGALKPADFMSDLFVPDYFCMNGKSGAFSMFAEDVRLAAFIGEPHLVRVLNAGVATHSLHHHGNHFYVTSVNNQVQDNVVFVDTFTLTTLENGFQGGLRGGSRAEWVFPFIRPPDIPGPETTPLRDLLPEELALIIGGNVGVPQSPLTYPMHCHTEMSQTALGGNYPQGLVTHVEFLGDLDKVPFPIPHIM